MNHKRTAAPLLSAAFALGACTVSFAQAPLYLTAAAPLDQRVEDLLAQMTLDEKIGQMMQVDHTAVAGNPAILTTYFIGSVLSGGDSKTGDNTTAAWANLYDTLQAHALATRLKIPILYGIDAVHGNSGVYGTTIFPHNIGMGCTRDSALVAQASRVTAREVAATGIDWTFGPCIAVPRDERWGRTYEGFGETPELARALGAAAVHGLQGDSLSEGVSIASCAKHYLADGGTQGGVDQGNTVADEAAIREIHLPGYVSAVDAGVATVMASFSSINGQKMHGSAHWLTDVLKTELGFTGVVVSDWAGVDQLDADYTSCVETAINAGVDMVMLPYRYNDFLQAMRSLVNGGRVPISRVDDAVRRILTLKFQKGLFEQPFADRTLIAEVGSAAHRTVARQCVRQSMVLLKRKDRVLPLPKSDGRILVAGSHADNLGYQCGGWSIRWQGGSGQTTIGTTILEAMRSASPTAQIDYSPTGEFADSSADYSVVVIGERPYAETMGDRTDLTLPSSDVELVRKMKAFGHPTVVILVTGRPLVIEPILHFADAVVAAWLPGTEGDGVADVLFGDHAPAGVLSHTWPKSMADIPINAGDSAYAPLYPYGFGIRSLADSPAGSSPAFLSGIVGGDGRVIELTFNKAMVSPAGGSATFALTREHRPFDVAMTPSLKPGDSTTILVQLDSAYRPQEAATIAYLSGDIASADGGMLQPFGPVHLYNWARPAAVTVPGSIEAENYSAMSGVQKEPTTDTGGGMDVTGIDDGDWLEYVIDVKKLGYYLLKLRIASASRAGSVSLSSDGRALGVMNLPVTGGWDAWTTAAQTVGLVAGGQTLRLAMNEGGFRLHWLAIEERPTSVDTSRPVTLVDEVGQNYPNPFNPSTTVRYVVREAGWVTIAVFDATGQLVRTLLERDHGPGAYTVTWDGRDAAGRTVASGTYVLQVRTPHAVHNRKVLLLR